MIASISYRLMKPGNADLILSERQFVRRYEQAHGIYHMNLKDANKVKVSQWWHSLGYKIRLRARGSWFSG